MSYEVDVRAVGEEGDSGDAVVLRFGNLARRDGHHVVVIDGGFKENGQDLIEFITSTYNTDCVDLVISTHPDNDHANGLKIVLEELRVAELWMHQPWLHSQKAAAALTNLAKRNALEEPLKRSLESAEELAVLAGQKGIPITEPFAGVQFANTLVVLGPTQAYYEELLAAQNDKLAVSMRDAFAAAQSLLKRVLNKVIETWDDEKLLEPDDNATSPTNNSSVVLFARLAPDRSFLFTGDAGVPALERALPEALADQLRPTLSHVQLPHHGSKRNIGPNMATRIFGPPVANGQLNGKTAFISAAKKGAPKHPAQRVINAAIRRGAQTHATQGSHKYYYSVDLPRRPNWVPIVPLELVEHFED